MISAKEIHELRFEKAAFGYKQEDIDEFLTQLEQEMEIAEQELEDSNEKIQVLADKVREYMRDEDALKDALLGAQREGHRIVAEANAKADGIIADAKKRADAMMDEVTVKHEALLAKNQAEIDEAHKALAEARKQVADFKKALFDMYKEHLEMLSTMPEEDDLEFGISTMEEETYQEPEVPITATAAATAADTFSTPSVSDPFSSSQFSAKTIQGAYDSRFGDLKDTDAE